MTLDEFGCDDYSVTRRSLLKTAGLASMAGVATSMFGDVLTSTVYGATNANVLIVLSLRGGADGLSMIVPHAESAYYGARPRSAVQKSRLLLRDGTFGLHPSFAPLVGRASQLAALHSVGLPAPDRSHFDAMERLEDADPGTSARVGWINRMVSGLAGTPDVFEGIQVGSTIAPTSLVGPAPTLSTSGFADLSGPFPKDPVLRARVMKGLRSQYKAKGGVVGRAGISALSLANRAAAINASVDKGPKSGATYPKYSELGQALRATAGLIRAGVGVRAVAVDSGGWDHHVDLNWRVDQRIDDLARSLAAFFRDLGSAASRVTVVTLSEFGRRLEENGSHGVDHGYGNAVFVLGAGVKGFVSGPAGAPVTRGYYSRWPTLAQGKRVDGDLAVTTDYRAVLIEILKSRFPEVNTSRVFPGVRANPLGFMA